MAIRADGRTRASAILGSRNGESASARFDPYSGHYTPTKENAAYLAKFISDDLRGTVDRLWKVVNLD